MRTSHLLVPHGRHPARTTDGKLPIKLIIALALVAALVGVGLFCVTKRRGAAVAAGSSVPKVATALLNLDEFIVNLADKSPTHYLSVTITLEVTKALPQKGEKSQEPSHGKEAAESKSPGGAAPDDLTPRVRDAVLEVLSAQTYQSLRTEKGRAQLKLAIKRNVNAKVKDIRVTHVLFSTFVMQ